MKVFPGSEQKSDDTSPPKHDHCDFETSLRIHIRHDSDNEWELCTSKKKDSFSIHFLQFFKTLERTLSSSFDSRNAWKWKQAHYTKRITYSSCIWHSSKGSFTTEKKGEKKGKSARACSTPGRTCTSLSYNEVKRDHMVLPPSNLLVNHMCACVNRSLCLSYLVLGLLVSPRSQQELHSCGVTIFRGQNESSEAKLQK